MVTLSADTKTLLALAEKIVAEGVKNTELLAIIRTYDYPREVRHTLTLDGHLTLTEAEAELLQRLGVSGSLTVR